MSKHLVTRSSSAESKVEQLNEHVKLLDDIIKDMKKKNTAEVKVLKKEIHNASALIKQKEEQIQKLQGVIVELEATVKEKDTAVEELTSIPAEEEAGISGIAEIEENLCSTLKMLEETIQGRIKTYSNDIKALKAENQFITDFAKKKEEHVQKLQGVIEELQATVKEKDTALQELTSLPEEEECGIGHSSVEGSMISKSQQSLVAPGHGKLTPSSKVKSPLIQTMLHTSMEDSDEVQCNVIDDQQILVAAQKVIKRRRIDLLKIKKMTAYNQSDPAFLCTVVEPDVKAVCSRLEWKGKLDAYVKQLSKM